MKNKISMFIYGNDTKAEKSSSRSTGNSASER